ncbi:MAG: HIT domain-containing protein [Anaerolineae bacterium]|nr:HIT domain-containing protein [Anaerolineae bacterium]
METLWSPWRMRYMMNSNKPSECIFCKAVQDEDDLESLVVLRRKNAFVILNRFPYTTGHIMIVPYAHVDSIEALDSETRAELMDLMAEMMILLRELYNPQAFNIGANIGTAAGAGIASHVHLHVVPRWNGDTNFMSTIGETRVLPEELPVTFERIREKLHQS